MSVKTRILMVSSEIVPFATAGGLADVLSALSTALDTLSCDVRVVLPRYYFINPMDLDEMLPHPISVVFGDTEIWSGVYRSKLPKTNVTVYFLDREEFFGRDGIYTDKKNVPFLDNLERFSFLCHGALKVCRDLNWKPDIIHCHDWPAALVPVILKSKQKDNFFEKTRSIFSIHNLGYQGIFSKETVSSTNFSLKEAEEQGLIFQNNVNLLHGALCNADTISTVSPRYAKEILTPEYGEQLDPLLNRRKDHIFGIVNGIDQETWAPETDPLLPSGFGISNIAGKKRLKTLLQAESHLPEKPDVPIIGMITRLVTQKGIIELCAPGTGSLYSICHDFNVQVIILGNGEPWCENELKTLEERLPNLKVFLGFNTRIAHLIEAGADFFLMPSKYEPCGLNQMYSQRYGTIPIATRTGGIADTVEEYTRKGGGTGFFMEYSSPATIYHAVATALDVWENKPAHIEAMRLRGMRKDFSWDKSARQYLSMYKATLKGDVD